MFASRGGRQGSSFLRETVASLTVERRGRNWPRVGERPQASASFSFLQPSRWAIDYRSFPLSLEPSSLIARLQPPSAPLQRPTSPSPQLCPHSPFHRWTRPLLLLLLLALFTPQRCWSTLRLCAVTWVVSTRSDRFHGKKERKKRNRRL